MPESTVTIFNVDIPVWDYCTAHEWEQLELLNAKAAEMGGTRSDLETFAMFAKSRCSKTVNIKTLLNKPIIGDELNSGVEALVAPFFEGLKARSRRNIGRLAEALSDPIKIKEEIGRLTSQVETLMEVLEKLESENDGQESER